MMKRLITICICSSIMIWSNYSCKKKDNEVLVASSIELLSGAGQQAQVETTLPASVVVQIKDQHGNPFEGATIHYAQSDGKASVAEITTLADGTASFNWNLGVQPGTQRLLITVSYKEVKLIKDLQLQVTALAKAKPLEAESIELVSGDHQSAMVGNALPNPIEVMVKDTHGNPLSGVHVNFSVSTGTLTAAGAKTDANGKASVGWTMETEGQHTLTITALKADGKTALSGSPITVTATATPVPATLELIGGTLSAWGVGKPLPQDIVAMVRDKKGQPFEGANIRFSIQEGKVTVFSSSNGSIGSNIAVNAITNSNGEGSVQWTLGDTYGPQKLTIAAFEEDGVTHLNNSPLEVIVTGTLSDYENNLYKTIEIGNQTWMAENLKSTTLKDGTTIPRVGDPYEWSKLNTPAYNWYFNSKAEYKEDYGGLYNWHTVITNKLCPDGWRVPNNADWNKLMNHLGGKNVAGGKLKENGTTYWQAPNSGATNSSGFGARAGGILSMDGLYESHGKIGIWWSYSSNHIDIASYWVIFHNSVNADNQGINKNTGCSVRCIKD